MKLTTRQRWEWAVAVFIAAYKGSTHIPLVKYFKSAWAVCRAMTVREEEVSDWVFDARMSACWDCPVFISKRSTCGFTEHEGQTLGCGCYLPVLARFKATRCWLRENTTLDGVGWPDELMPQ